MAKTYADLKKDVQTFLNRTDPETIASIPTFIALAESEFSRAVKLPFNEGIYTQVVSPTTGSAIIEFPDDFISPIGMSINGEPYTRINGYAYLNLTYSLKDVPEDGKYFAKYNNTIQFYPTLKDGDIIVMIYHKALVPMQNDTDTSPALDEGYDCMLYWALKHASVYLRDPQEEAVWSQKVTEASETMYKSIKDAHWAGSPLRVLNI